MLITLRSTFHAALDPIRYRVEVGDNIRRLRGARARYCLDYRQGSRTNVCGCGWPCRRTRAESPAGVAVTNIEECGPDGDRYGRGFVRITVEPEY